MNTKKGPRPTVPIGSSKNAPVKSPEVANMEHFHKLAASGALADLLFKMGGGKK